MKKFDLIKAAHANFIHLPPPEHVLVNDEAQKRLEASGIVFAGRYTANGAGSGFGKTGAKAIQELAAMLWRENPKYHLGTESG